MITVYWKDGGISSWASTYLSFSDGYLYEYNHLHTDQMEELGVRLTRGFHSTDPSDTNAHFIAEEKVIITPAELGSVLMVVSDTKVKLMYDPKLNRLVDVLLPQIEEVVFGETEKKGDLDSEVNVPDLDMREAEGVEL